MDFITVLKIILIGIVEGITEWLPVSSTGHMIIFENLLGLEAELGASYWSLFLVVIQFGAILAVILTFFKALWPFGKKKTSEEKKEIWRTWLLILVACVPAAVIGVFLDDLLDQYLYNFITVSITLIVYGIFFIVLEIFFKKTDRSFNKEDIKDMTVKTALIIGLAQVLALIPGTSRSGVTILAGMMIGCSRSLSTKFSFFVSIPIMLGASLFKVVKYFAGGESMTGAQVGYLLIGMAVAFGVSLLCIKLLQDFVKKHTFIGFGYYRIALGIVLIILFVTVLKDSGSTEQATALLTAIPVDTLTKTICCLRY